MVGSNSKVTKPEQYIAALAEPRKSEIAGIDDFIRKTVPELKPYMQSGIIGYGNYKIKYATGRIADWCLIGLASNKNYISLYVMGADKNGYLAEQSKARLPKASIGKSCIRFKKFADLDETVIAELLKKSAKMPEKLAELIKA
jgi:hypothetical protein